MRREQLLDVYRRTRRIAVVGASATPGKPAHDVPAYLQSQGFEIVPVNPRGDVMFGVPAAKDLSKIRDVDVVNVFRHPTDAEAIARAAPATGATVLWFQPGTHSAAGVAVARANGLEVVRGICMGALHRKLGLERQAGPSE